MPNRKDRWEHGSEFHWIGAIDSRGESDQHPWSGQGLSFGSGRDALRALSQIGRDFLGWKKLYVPSFLCQEVVGALVGEGIRIESYPDDPQTAIEAPCPNYDEALLVVNTFGLRPRWRRPAGSAGAVIEDHTHDPWSDWARSSEADYCIASLRKTLPVPDGGVLWSPKGQLIPGRPVLTPAHHTAATRKLEAMLLKALYLDGYPVEKKTFRDLAIDGEKEIASGEISAIDHVSAALVSIIHPIKWREQRRQNHAHLAAHLIGMADLDVIEVKDSGSCPFSVIVVCRDNRIRDRLRQKLIEQRIYSAVLWPLESCAVAVPEASVALSRCVLSLHCDGRYDKPDMDRVAEAVVKSIA
ncbi:MAG TPA: hypothetical protein PKM59_07535 [Thermodesulfobacteriota bacterium]|nr:hypothetical protein [Thermodesulfobacteriota bacterium]